MNGQQTYAIIIKARLRLDEGEFDPSDNDSVTEVMNAVVTAIDNTDIEVTEGFDDEEEPTAFVLMIDECMLDDTLTEDEDEPSVSAF